MEYTTKQAAEILRVSYRTVYRLIADGRLKAQKRGFGLKQPRYVIKEKDLNKIKHE